VNAALRDVSGSVVGRSDPGMASRPVSGAVVFGFFFFGAVSTFGGGPADCGSAMTGLGSAVVDARVGLIAGIADHVNRHGGRLEPVQRWWATVKAGVAITRRIFDPSPELRSRRESNSPALCSIPVGGFRTRKTP
jgi:hypothetical protein